MLDRFFRKIILISLIAACCAFSGGLTALAQVDIRSPGKSKVSRVDNELLDDLSKRSFMYFWEQSDPKTGLTLDRTQTDGTRYPSADFREEVASIAASGFALTSYCIAADRKWLAPNQARERARSTLEFFANRAFQKNGWFYHWMNMRTGARVWNSEVSSIDTALLLAGVLTVRGCFREDPEIVRLAAKIYDRVDFRWMQNGDEFLLSHGWHPETGFIRNRWNDYSESSILYLLAIGSRTNPISWKSWYAWKRGWVEYGKYRYLAAVPPLFIHQYSQAWIDFRAKREHFQKFNVNYFDNSVSATFAHRQFFIDVLSKEFPSYSTNIWGLTSSDSAKGYLAWGAPPRDPETDGTVVPCAAGGSLMFTPEISIAALTEMKSRFGDKIYGRYGFADSFNPATGWVNPDVLGIDVGITLISAENSRSGNVWRWFMRNVEVNNALRKVKIY